MKLKSIRKALVALAGVAVAFGLRLQAGHV